MQESPNIDNLKQQQKSRLHKHSIHSKKQLMHLLDNLLENQDNSLYDEHFSESSFNSDNMNEGEYNDGLFDNEEHYHHYSLDDSLHRTKPIELSIMASMKQVKGNSGTLFALMDYSQSDGDYHR